MLWFQKYLLNMEYWVIQYFDFEDSVSLYSFIDMVCKGTGGVNMEQDIQKGHHC